MSFCLPSLSLQWKEISLLCLKCLAFTFGGRLVIALEPSRGRRFVPGVTGELSFAKDVGTDSYSAGIVDCGFSGPFLTPQSMSPLNCALRMEFHTTASTFSMVLVTMALILWRQQLTVSFRTAPRPGSATRGCGVLPFEIVCLPTNPQVSAGTSKPATQGRPKTIQGIAVKNGG